MSEIVGQLLLGWLLADFLTGTFHWWEDEFGNEEWPLIGPWLITPNRLHHVDPLAFAANGFWGRNCESIAIAILVGIGWAWVAPSFFMAAFLVGAALANEVHFLAHSPKNAGPIARVLQQTGVFQSPKVHAAHHRPPFAHNYCVLTDWLNPALEAVGFWRRVERAFR